MEALGCHKRKRSAASPFFPRSALRLLSRQAGKVFAAAAQLPPGSFLRSLSDQSSCRQEAIESANALKQQRMRSGVFIRRQKRKRSGADVQTEAQALVQLSCNCFPLEFSWEPLSKRRRSAHAICNPSR